jgi:hypothetical protein
MREWNGICRPSGYVPFDEFLRFVVKSKLAGNNKYWGQYPSESLDLFFDFFLVPPMRQRDQKIIKIVVFVRI